MRVLVVIFGVVLLGTGLLASLLVGGAGGIVPAVLGALVLLGSLWERHIYRRPASTAPGPGWQRTRERFRDPTTGQAIDVWFNPATGQRSYVRAEPAAMADAPAAPRAPQPR